MNEITRIHLAKTPYNIENQAHTALRSYLDAIQKALHADSDAMREIESRMTELLADRGVGGDMVIAMADVEALQKQLGDPKDFAGEEITDDDSDAQAPKTKLMRDTSNAMLGGVCSGIAAYFGWDAVWVRIAAVILVFITSGVMIPIYIILLVVMPEAKTAADRLEMAGSPVNLETLKQNAAATIEHVEPVLLKVVRATLGVLLIVAAAASAVTAAAAAVYMTVRPDALDYFEGRLEMGISVGLMALGGVMLAVFCGILAYMVLHKATRRNLVAALILTTLVGIGSFGAGIAIPITHQVALQNKLVAPNEKKRLAVDLTGVTALRIRSSVGHVQYTVSDTRREAVLQYNNYVVKTPGITLTRQGDTLVVDGGYKKGSICYTRLNICDNTSMRFLDLSLTGPALETITAEHGDVVYKAASQDALSVEHGSDTLIEVTSNGHIGTVSVKGTGGSLDATSATIGTVNLDALRTSNAFASVDALNITAQTSSCSEPVTVTAKHAGTVQVNGQSWTPSTQYACLALQIDGRD